MNFRRCVHIPVASWISLLIAACNVANTQLPTVTMANERVAIPSEVLSIGSPSPTSKMESATPSPPLPTPTEGLRVITRGNLKQVDQLGSALPLDGYAEYLGRHGILFNRENEVWVADPVSPNEIVLYKATTGEQIGTLAADESDIRLLIADHAGNRLAAVSPGTDSIIIWDLSSQQLIQIIEFDGFLEPFYFSFSLAGSFSLDDRVLAVSGCRVPRENVCASSEVILYEVETGSILSRLSGFQEITHSLAFHPIENILLLAGRKEEIIEGDLIFWDVANEIRVKVITLPERSAISLASYAQDGSILALVGSFWVEEDLLTAFTLQLVSTSTWISRNCEFSDGLDLVHIAAFSSTGDFIVTDGPSFWDRNCRHLSTAAFLYGDPYDLKMNLDGTRIYMLDSLNGLTSWGIPNP